MNYVHFYEAKSCGSFLQFDKIHVVALSDQLYTRRGWKVKNCWMTVKTTLNSSVLSWRNRRVCNGEFEEFCFSGLVRVVDWSSELVFFCLFWRCNCRRFMWKENLLFLYTVVVLDRLRWSRGSVLAFSTQVCGFKPGRSRQIFTAKKSSAHLPLEGEVKLSVPYRRFAACNRSLNLHGSRNLGKITTGHLSRPQFHLSLLGSLASLQTEAPGG